MMARRVIAGRGGFSPKALFAAGEQGVWYDPSDFSTLFQDAAGTTPVTAVEQPVGLMLDKSKGLVLGPELVTNGDFSNGTTGWTLYKEHSGGSESAAVVSGALQITFPSTSPSKYCQFTSDVFTTVVGKTYRVQAKSPVRVSGTSVFYGKVRKSDTVLPGSNMVNIVGADKGVAFGNGVGYFTATSTSTRIVLQVNMPESGTDVVISFDNISVRELPGNHAFQTTSANRPTLSARYNLLTKTEQFDNAVWIKSGVTITANAAVAPDGTTTADTLTAKNADPYVSQVVTAVGNLVGRVSLKQGASRYARISGRSGTVGGAGTYVGDVYVDLSNGNITATNTAGGAFTATVTATANGFYNISLAFTSPGAGGGLLVQPTDSSNSISVVVGTSSIYIWGADLRVANDGVGLPPYQRVNTATDYDTVGFPLYLRFNGSTQFLQTNSIDFTSTDKVLVAAGVRKLSDTEDQIIYESSSNQNTNSGTIGLSVAGVNNAASWRYSSKGTIRVFADAVWGSSIAPSTKILTGISDIAGDSAILRINGAQAASSTADQGTGNYGNYPLYIGARTGTSLYFNGHLYSLIVRGAQTPANLIAATERYVARKTGVTL